MTREQVVVLFNSLNNLGSLKGVKFAYAVAKNINILKGDVEAIDTSIKMTEEFNAFETARMELVNKFAKKDAKGNSVIENQRYVIEDQKKFDKEFEKLKLEHKPAVEARQKQIDEYNAMLKEDATVTLHKVKLADVPEEITGAQMHSIMDIIEE